MTKPIVVVLLIVGLVMIGLALGGKLGAMHLPGNDQDYEPAQPIAFSHRLHAGELQVACIYCHSGAEKSRTAGIPPASTCMNCHKFVTAPIASVRAEQDAAQAQKRQPNRVISPEIHKVYDALGLDDELKPDLKKKPHAIQWTQIHSLPAFVQFDHSRHVNAGVTCQTCHGPVESMERVRQVQDLSMGWCVNCHRDANANGVAGKPVMASTDCAACHY